MKFRKLIQIEISGDASSSEALADATHDLESALRDVCLDYEERGFHAHLHSGEPYFSDGKCYTDVDAEGFIVEPGHPSEGMRLVDCEGYREGVDVGRVVQR